MFAVGGLEMKRRSLPPFAPSLVESIRSLGYTLETAVADLIDNSITAKATTVHIKFSPYGEPFLAILDNGYGMDSNELEEAMRHGCKNPCDLRTENDLGRYGLGLKTASLSQCRKLIVVSYRNGLLSACCWDLDVIMEEKEWILIEFEQEEIRDLPFVSELKIQSEGTLVLWKSLDRIASGEESLEKALGDKMDRTRDHLSLVFHRYLNGEPGIRKLSIVINDNPVEPVDPFLTLHRATEPMIEENIVVEGHTIKIKPYILPHLSKLSREELNYAGGEEGLRRHQGFYVYRNKRLIIWGTWFRLIRQEELTKLARVRVDIPNALDHLWTLDIKKSKAHPPEAVRQNLRRIVERIAEGSKRVYKFRGRKVNDDNLIHSWERIQGRKGISYLINREHPIIQSLSLKLDDESYSLLEMLLETLESTYPIDSLYADMASDNRIGTYNVNIADRLMEIANCLIETASTIDGGSERLLNNLHQLDPFCLYPDITTQIVRRFEDAKRQRM